MNMLEVVKSWFPGTFNVPLMGSRGAYCSADIQNAIAAGYKTFYFPRGTYSLDEPVTFPSGFFTIYGDSRGECLIQIAGDNKNMFIVDGTTNLEIHDVHLHKIGTDSIIKTSPSGQLIDSVIDRTWFSGSNRGATGIDCLFSTTTIKASIFENLALGINIQNEPSYINLSDLMFSDCEDYIAGGGVTVLQSNIQVF